MEILSRLGHSTVLNLTGTFSRHSTVRFAVKNIHTFTRVCSCLHTLNSNRHLTPSVLRSCVIQPSCNVYTVTGLASTLWDSLKPRRLKHRKYILKQSALRLYLCCVELIDHDAFIQELNLPDTLAAWFRISELHIWMCLVRLAQEEKEGVLLRNYLMEYFWQDLDKKSRKLGSGLTATVRSENIQRLSEQFKASLFAYDEGLLSDDKTLAGALWRNLFDKSCADAQHLEMMVQYVRKQIVHLDQMDSSVLQTAGLFTFLPFKDSPESVERNKHILMQIAKRV